MKTEFCVDCQEEYPVGQLLKVGYDLYCYRHALLLLAPPHPHLPRVDTVAVYDGQVEIFTGMPARVPVPCDLFDGTFPLAYISVPPGLKKMTYDLITETVDD